MHIFFNSRFLFPICSIFIYSFFTVHFKTKTNGNVISIAHYTITSYPSLHPSNYCLTRLVRVKYNKTSYNDATIVRLRDYENVQNITFGTHNVELSVFAHCFALLSCSIFSQSHPILSIFHRFNFSLKRRRSRYRLTAKGICCDFFLLSLLFYYFLFIFFFQKISSHFTHHHSALCLLFYRLI